MDRDKYRLIYKGYRRSLEKKFGGYISEAFLYSSYLFKRKNDPIKKFVILGFQRTGSTLLVELLDSHPLINCKGELLLNRMLFPKYFLKCNTRISNHDVFGFKLLTPHFDYQNIKNPDQFMVDLNNSGYKILKLKRRNLFRSAISLLYAINSRRFHFQYSYLEKDLQKIVVDPLELLEKLNWIEYHSVLLDRISNKLPHLEIVYEDDLMSATHHKDTVNRISDYLSIPRATAHTKLIKFTDDISDFISNADEIKTFIYETKYAKYLDM